MARDLVNTLVLLFLWLNHTTHAISVLFNCIFYLQVKESPLEIAKDGVLPQQVIAGGKGVEKKRSGWKIFGNINYQRRLLGTKELTPEQSFDETV